MVNISHDDYFSYSSDTQKVNSLKTDINAKLCDDWKKRIVNLPETNIIRPEYYGGKDNTYEVFNVLESWELDKDFYLGNVIKYVVRAGKKSSSVKQDLEKALVYLQKRIDTL